MSSHHPHTPTAPGSRVRRQVKLGMAFVLVAASFASATPTLANAQCAPGTEPSDRPQPTIATSISDTSSELFVGELLDAIAGDAPTGTEDCAPVDFDPFENLLPNYDDGLELGLWKAQAGLWGTFSQDFGGASMLWDGSVEANFDFAVSDDRSAVGAWDFTGDGDISATLPEGDMTADQHFEGSGDVSGDSALLNLNGTSVTTGTFTATVNGFSITDSIDSSPTTNPPHPVRVRAVACGEAYGDWTYSVEDNIEAAGFNASFDGMWSAYRDNEAGAALARADYTSGVSTEAKTAFATVANYIVVYNQFVDDFRTWDTQSVFNFMEALEAELNNFRNFTECDIEFFGQDNVTTAINALMFLMQGLLVGSDDLDQTLTGSEFRELLHVAVRTGAIGSAAPNPVQALRAEQGLLDAGRRLLTESFDPTDLGIFVTDDTSEVVRLGALMNWTYEVEGYHYPAREVYDQYQAAVAALEEGS